jgi:hypothetical protein
LRGEGLRGLGWGREGGLLLRGNCLSERQRSCK